MARIPIMQRQVRPAGGDLRRVSAGPGISRTGNEQAIADKANMINKMVTGVGQAGLQILEKVDKVEMEDFEHGDLNEKLHSYI